MSPDSRPLDAYIRVSRVGDRDVESDAYQTEDTQRKAIESWARGKDFEIRWNEPERNVSGGTLDRPVLNRIRERIRNGESAGVAIYRLTRLSRNVVGTLTIFGELAQHNANVYSATEPKYDATDGQGKFQLTINAALGEYFLAEQKAAWKTAVLNAVERGAYVGRGIPFGYVKGENGVLQKSPDAPLVTEAFSRKVDGGQSLGEIASWLKTETGEHWTGSTVGRMLARDVYLGWSTVRGKEIQVENENAHAPLTDEVTFRAAQSGSREVWTHYDGDDVALLSGKVRCSGCRYVMPKSIDKKQGRAYYRCRGKRESGDCLSPASIRADGPNGIDEWMLGVMSDSLRQLAEDSPSLAEGSSDLAEATEELAHAERELEEFQTNLEAQEALGTAFLAFAKARVDRVEEARTRVSTLRVDQGSQTAGLTADDFLGSPNGEQARVIADFVDAIMVRKAGPQGNRGAPIDSQRVRVLWHGQGQEWPRQGAKADEVRPYLWD